VPPGAATYALVALSTAATVIASQALISGVFSLTHQAIALGLFPRVTVTHTSESAEGQIYVPEMNWALAVACVMLVLKFDASAKLAAAYGIAVSGTMGITSIVYYEVARKTWGWPVAKALPVLLLFLSFDLPFFGSNLFKIVDGGYLPIGIATILTALMLVWHRGRRLLGQRLAATSSRKFLDGLESRLLGRTPGTSVFLSGEEKGIPPVLTQYAERLHVLPRTVVIFTAVTDHVPFVRGKSRVKVTALDEKARIYRVIAHVGFMQRTDLPKLLAIAAKQGLPIDLEDTSYLLGRETLLATDKGEMGKVTESIFSFLLRNARGAAEYFSLPPEKVVEIGTQIDL